MTLVITTSLICLVLLIGGGLGLLRYGEDGYRARHFIAGLVGFLSMVMAVSGAGFILFGVWFYIGAAHQANIINREYGTSYTQAEVFFASDVIDTVRELDRRRIEVNGDLMRPAQAP